MFQAEVVEEDPMDPAAPDTDALLAAASEAADSGDRNRALELYGQILVHEPQHPQASCGMANALRSIGKLDAAEQVLQSAMEVHPGDTDLLLERGELAYGRKQMPEAEGFFGRALQIDEGNSAAALGMADVFTATGREEQAQALLEDLHQRCPDDPDVALRLGWNRLRSDRLSGAMAHFSRALTNSATSYSARLGIAHMHLLRRNFAASKGELRKAIEARPTMPPAYCNLAWVYAVERQDLDEAELLCEKSLELDSSYASAFDCLGVISFQRADARQAERHFEKAVELDPAETGTRVRLGLLYSQLGDPSEARRCFDEAIERDPSSDLAFYGRGSIFYHSGEFALALRDFRRATVINSQNSLAISGLALTLARLGNSSEACSLLNAGLTRVLSRDSWQLRLALAQVLFHAGQELKDQDLFHDALGEAERAMQARKGSKEICFIAGLAAARATDYLKAEAYFQEVVRLDSLDLRAKHSLRLIQTLTDRRRRADVISPVVKWTLFAAVFVQILAFWFDFPRKIGDVQFAALLPIFMGLMLVVFFLPRLIALKLPGGFEAKLEVATNINPAEMLLKLKPDEALPSYGIILGLPSER